MLEQVDEEWQVGLLHPLLVERQDEPVGSGFDEVITILYPLGNALCGEQLADVVAGEKLGDLINGHMGIDGQLNCPPCYAAIHGARSASQTALGQWAVRRGRSCCISQHSIWQSAGQGPPRWRGACFLGPGSSLKQLRPQSVVRLPRAFGPSV